MSKAIIASAAVLKPEIRLDQAVSQFVSDLSSEQKAAFLAQKSQFEKSAPDESDVMRLTVEINRASLVKGGRGGFGPRMNNFLYAVQQFAAIGDVLVGGSQNVFACGIVRKANQIDRARIVLLKSFSGP
jgi:ankyrin repeat domain-containing protein 50